MKLYSYWRSSAAFRVRIALNVKQLNYETISINLKPGEDQQYSEDYAALNPQSRIPFLIDGEVTLGQSTAIIEYLEERYSESPLLPTDFAKKAQVRQFVNVVACDIHPLNNLSVLKKLQADFNATEAQKSEWYASWIQTGFKALEAMLAESAGDFCQGDSLTMADVYLVPQVWNANRFEVDISAFPTIRKVYEHCLTLDAVQKALPENQPDAP